MFAQEQDDIFTIVEEMPYFGTCSDTTEHCFKSNFFPYVEANLKYPESYPEGIEKIRTYMKFVVNKSGGVEGVEIAKSSTYPSYDAAALEVINNLPVFVPGKQKGKPVSVQYLVPIDFIIKENMFPIEEAYPYATNDEGEVFTVVEKMPLFGSCDNKKPNEKVSSYYKEVYTCSQENIKNYLTEEVAKIRSSYPSGYFASKVQFIIEKDGKLTNASVKIGSGNASIDVAALNIITNMQGWTGGTQRGIPVRILYVLPVIFK